MLPKRRFGKEEQKMKSIFSERIFEARETFQRFVARPLKTRSENIRLGWVNLRASRAIQTACTAMCLSTSQVI